MKPVKGSIQWIAPELSPAQIKLIEKELLGRMPEKETQLIGVGGEYFNGFSHAIDSMHKVLKEYFNG